MNKIKFQLKNSQDNIFVPEELVDIVFRAKESHGNDSIDSTTLDMLKVDIIIAIKEKWGLDLPINKITCIYNETENKVIIEIYEDWICKSFNTEDPSKYYGCQGTP